MGVMLLGKMKIHELAKKLDKTSKEIIAIAQELGFEVKSHMSAIEEEQIKKIEDRVKGANESDKKESKPKKEKEIKKEKGEEPVIIRRHVIISDEEVKRKED